MRGSSDLYGSYLNYHQWAVSQVLEYLWELSEHPWNPLWIQKKKSMPHYFRVR